MFCFKLLLILNLTNTRLPLEAYLYHRMVSCAPNKSMARPFRFKNLCPSKKTPTVTRQLTKSIDICQNYLCDFHPWWGRSMSSALPCTTSMTDFSSFSLMISLTGGKRAFSFIARIEGTVYCGCAAVLRIRHVYPLITDPDFCPSRISDPGSKNSNKREGWKKIVVLPFFVATKIPKLKIILILNWLRKKFGPIYKEL